MSVASSPLLLHRGINIISDGLVGFWEMEDETTVKDLSGNINDIPITGATLVDSTHGKKGLYFDGVDDICAITTTPEINTRVRSWVIKFKISSIPTQGRDYIVYNEQWIDPDAMGSSILISTDNAIKYIGGAYNGGWFSKYVKTNISLDKEYIVVITIGETYFNAWVNGIKTIDNISSQGGVKVSSYNYTIGKIYDTGIFNGTLDFLRMYNRELTEEEAIKITNRRG